MKAFTIIDDACDLALFKAARARASDPVTSHQAAASVNAFAGDHKAKIVAFLRRGPAGATRIADGTGLGRDAVGKRTTELEREGVIVRHGTERNRKGRSEAMWMLKVTENVA
jgi:predicted ArsR family transcriptional regulator